MIQICDTALFCMYRSVTPTLELALCKQRPAHYLFGKLNATEFVQKLAAQGIVDAKVGLGETGKLIAVYQSGIYRYMRCRYQVYFV